MIHRRHETLTVPAFHGLSSEKMVSSLTSSHAARIALTDVTEGEPPTWPDLRRDLRPPFLAETYPASCRTRWQHVAASRVEQSVTEFPMMGDSKKLMLRSQSSLLSEGFLDAVPCDIVTRFTLILFEVVLLLRLRLSLPDSARVCRCRRQLDSFCHHRAACARAGLLATGFAVECATARIRSSLTRLSTNVSVRDLDLVAPQEVLDGRRLETLGLNCLLFGNPISSDLLGCLSITKFVRILFAISEK